MILFSVLTMTILNDAQCTIKLYEQISKQMHDTQIQDRMSYNVNRHHIEHECNASQQGQRDTKQPGTIGQSRRWNKIQLTDVQNAVRNQRVAKNLDEKKDIFSRAMIFLVRFLAHSPGDLTQLCCPQSDLPKRRLAH